ncbi:MULTISPECIES: type VII secretion-associated serine protease mycosin [Streptacidiphilus]|uniref:Type VII secretion-associated serine protease mycosin n=1 Tax=Streptacidiphilus cavernicola TaxID=3342716 RepID=A0ABV6ULQ3_9ACTN|nr:type VII secretion-associated serine protease mycosin [Streptacidiphilus jeojiense]
MIEREGKESTVARSGGRAVPPAIAAFCAVAALLMGSAAPARAASLDVRDKEWWLTSMHATDQMWPVSTGKGITVAVIDSGVNASHPDLVGQVLAGQNFSGLPGGATTDVDKESHGTGMASLIAGTGKGLNGKGMYGLAPGVKILPLRIVGKGDNEAAFAANYSPQLAAAIRAGADSSAKILSISQAQIEDEPNVRSAVAYALSKGKLVVAGVGNNAKIGNPVEYPAAFPGVAAVGSINAKSQVASYSEYGPQVDFTAPGDGMYNACNGPTGYCYSSGTSDATAIFSASAALLWSAHPSWTADQVLNVLKNTASQGDQPGVQDPYYGYGIIRPRIALTNPGDPGPADVNPLTSQTTASSSAAPSGSAAAPVVSGTPAATASASAAPQAAAKKSGGSTGLFIGIGVGVVVVLGAVAAFVLRSRNKRPGPPPPPPSAPSNPYGHLPDPYRQ